MQHFMASTHRNGWGTTPSGLPQRFEPLTPSATRKTATSTTSTLLITDAGLDDAHLAELSAAGLTVERRTRADSSQPFGRGLQVRPQRV